MSEALKERKAIDKFIDAIERVGNKLPPPPILFFALFIIVGIIGAIFSISGVSLINPATQKAVTAQNFFSTDGLHWILKSMVTNFTGFAPLGLVITMTIAIGFCEESGMLVAMLRNSLKNVSPAAVPYAIAFAGTIGNIASDTAMVVIPPLAAIVYIGVKKHPVVGMIVGLAGAQAGFTANVMIAGTDVLLQGLTNQALESFLGERAKDFLVDPTCNWFFMIASTFLCSAVIGYVSVKIIEPRFGKYHGASEDDKIEEVTPLEKKGLRMSGVAAMLYIGLIVLGFFMGPLAGKNGAFMGSPLLSGLIPIIFMLFSITGITYGFVTKKFKNSKDINQAMVKQMTAMGSYIVFCFFCGQFQGLFNWTRLGTLLAVKGSDVLTKIGLRGIPLSIAFILLCATVNLFITSGSAKWAIFAPIFVPMLFQMGYQPGFTQLLYRIGDSPGNVFTPMSGYIWMVMGVAQIKYDKDLKIGTMISNTLPIAIVLQISWIIMLMIWMALGLPIGPGSGIYLPA